MRRDYKIKFTDKSKANLWIYLDLAKFHCLKGLTSPYIISYLHFLNLNNILTFPPPNFGLCWSGVWLDTNDVCLVFWLPDLHACVQNKCKFKLSILSRACCKTQWFQICYLVHVISQVWSSTTVNWSFPNKKWATLSHFSLLQNEYNDSELMHAFEANMSKKTCAKLCFKKRSGH